MMTTVPTAGDEERLVAELKVYAAQQERAADGMTYLQDGFVRVTDPAFLVALFTGSAALIIRLRQERDEARAEVSRCHERLEIDHYWKIGENDDSDLERVEVPMEERGGIPDGISARDATVALMQEDLSASNAEAERLREALEQAHDALRPFAEYAPYVEMFVEGRAKFGGSPILPTKHFRKSHFDAARAALQGSAKQ